MRGNRKWAGSVGALWRKEGGQATVELAVVLPVAIIVAVIVVNALSFFSTCAMFDRLCHQAVCSLAAAPDAGEGADDAAGRVEAALRVQFPADNLTVSVRAEGAGLGPVRFVGRIEYAPTLFGLGLRREVLGVALPPLVHETSISVDVYRPGMLF